MGGAHVVAGNHGINTPGVGHAPPRSCWGNTPGKAARRHGNPIPTAIDRPCNDVGPNAQVMAVGWGGVMVGCWLVVMEVETLVRTVE